MALESKKYFKKIFILLKMLLMLINLLHVLLLFFHLFILEIKLYLLNEHHIPATMSFFPNRYSNFTTIWDQLF